MPMPVQASRKAMMGQRKGKTVYGAKPPLPHTGTPRVST